MEVEQIEILGFIRQFAPFDSLPDAVLEQVAGQVEVAYYRAGTPILNYGDQVHDLYLVRSGAVEIYRRSGELYNRLSEGSLFGQMGLLMNNRVRLAASALEDTLLYCLPETLFHELCAEFESFADFVEVEDRTRLRQTLSRQESANELMTSSVRELISRAPVTISLAASVQEAAQRMTEEGVSSILVLHPESPADDGGVAGILTDRDLRTRVLAAGLPLQTPVAEVMSADLVALESGQFVFEAMLTMLRYNLHHLPVLHRGRPVGVIALSDVMRYESRNSLFVVRHIFRAHSPEELALVAQDVRASFLRMVNEDANSQMIGSAMAVIGRSFKQRLLELAESELGPPPVPYCFLALGSMARDEQLIVTDQDNAIILDNRYDPSRDGDYFAALGRYVCDGLAACGYGYCKGGIMATNVQWQKTRQQWEHCFNDWIDNPSPESLLHSSIFFDLAGVFGKTEWAEQLNALIARRARRSPRFLACMARNALNRTPPLGFFKAFVMEQDGKHNNSINLKRRGTAPLADLIRVHALAIGSRAQNSFERLKDVIEAGVLPKGRGPDLRDAMEFIAMVRIRHQALDLAAGREPDNNIEPETLSDFERRNLKDAFQILRHAQKFLKFRYQPNRG
ncbi:putative nucleotidyltransferase substrate binding domain-containing protein [Zobellella iuensis]|uniref:Cyclic nucleotide-binding/CBS domain-containing protein n=1 Tax=Zobellella iuensis TaxID=2803811 RepID=A0ABS1QTX6_9GAMM|nr:putative nucleotidyltransferase substrate binding domain-containing protein [Zobellella iuensis]MBL1378330.1 cyclic nucleotide-binding/CBS domain-containing protein [Zobellella iuensis]